MNPLNNIIMNKDITHQYKVPTPADFDALRQGVERMTQIKQELSLMQGRIQKFINTIGDVQDACKSASSYVQDCCDAAEEERRPSAETVAGFYAKVMEIKVLSSEYSDLFATMADSLSEDSIDYLQQRTCDVIYCVNQLPFENETRSVDNTQSTENNGTAQ